MKSLFKTIGYTIAIISIFFGYQTYAQITPGQCLLDNIEFIPYQNVNEETEVKLIITPGHEDCGQNETSFELEITEAGGIDSDIYDDFHKFHINQQPFELNFKPGGEYCTESAGCNYFIWLKILNKVGYTVPSPTSGIGTEVRNDLIYRSEEGNETSFFNTQLRKDKARLVFPCTGSCESKDFVFISTVNDYGDEDQICRVTSVEFFPGGLIDDSAAEPFINPDEQLELDAEIKIADCAYDTIFRVEIWDSNGIGDGEVEEVRLRGKVIGSTINIKYKPGDTDCDAEDSAENGYCIYGFTVRAGNDRIYNLTETDPPTNNEKVRYYCGLAGCDETDWSVVTHNMDLVGTVPEETTPIQFFDKNSPCYVEIGQGNSENGVGLEKEGYIEDCYEFLAPIPGFKTTDRADKNNLIIEGNRVAIRDVKELKLGDYINSMFQIALGVLMVLSVVMIVVAGVQYMTVESFYGKSDAKKRISGALMGLILSLGIVIILNTINPRLLEINFGEGIESVTINVKTIDLGYLNSIDVAGIPDVDLTTMLQNEAFVLYIAHQQGKGGASAIFHSVKNNSNKVITSKYTSSPEKIQANVDNQFKKPTNLDDFLNYFYKRIIKFTNDTTNRDNIPQQYKDAIQQAASAQGVNYGAMITMCMIESYLCNQSPQGIPAHLVDNGQGYRGLFQFGEAAWADYGKAPYLTNVVIATENALAGAKMFRANVGIKDLF